MKIMKVFLVLPFFVFSTAAFADKTNVGRYLSSYEPSYFIWAQDSEDSYIRFQISVKYPMSKCKYADEYDACDNEKGLWYFAYTGVYDFFVQAGGYGRDSSPIVSRLQNPGIFYRWHYDVKDKNGKYSDPNKALKSLTVGWFHESNGQNITDATVLKNTPYGSDYVSRGWDYLGIDFKSLNPLESMRKDPHTYYLRLRWFCDCQAFGTTPREDKLKIFGINEDLKIENFDGIRLLLRNEITSKFSYAFGFRTGTRKPLEHNTFQAELTYDIDGWPLSLIYFDGYGKNISTYHEKDKYIGFGIKLW